MSGKVMSGKKVKMKMPKLGGAMSRRRPAPVSKAAPVSQAAAGQAAAGQAAAVQAPVSTAALVSQAAAGQAAAGQAAAGQAPVSKATADKNGWFCINTGKSSPSGVKYQGELRQYCIDQMIRGKCDCLEIRSGHQPHRNYQGRLRGNFQEMFCRLTLDGFSVFRPLPIDGRGSDCFKLIKF